ncbi:MAG: hypothetical protein JSR77_01720 [Planctomycetes bacterium]|nr:hypothetical protein [Planctomycetota bacterium]
MALFPSSTTTRTLTVYWDDIQEGIWFQSLHPRLRDAALEQLTGAADRNPKLARVLRYDRPDIVLADGTDPILVVERTVEVPSGHNVGQRFPRLAAAAQCQIPVVYMGPYAAKKHGGKTAGPRYMNLRLFKALDEMARIENTAVTVINWPVDAHYEVIQTPAKDARIRAFMDVFFQLYDAHGIPRMNAELMRSPYEQTQIAERAHFEQHEVEDPTQYDSPPDSVRIVPTATLGDWIKAMRGTNGSLAQSVVYDIGMTYMRSDPYTGMGVLYSYLYAGGMRDRTRYVVLRFPAITKAMWTEMVRRSPASKTIRLYREIADAIVFRDGPAVRAALP